MFVTGNDSNNQHLENISCIDVADDKSSVPLIFVKASHPENIRRTSVASEESIAGASINDVQPLKHSRNTCGLIVVLFVSTKPTLFILCREDIP